MDPTATPNTTTNHTNVRVRKCSACNGIGHDRRNCPTLLTTAVGARSDTPIEDAPCVEIPPLPPLANSQPSGNPLEINMERVLYFVFDLETTDFVHKRDEIVKIAGLFLAPDQTFIEDAKFQELIKPKRPLNDTISTLTGINNNDLSTKSSFSVVGKELLSFIDNVRDNFHEDGVRQTDLVMLVAHNGKRFDIPFLLAEFEKNNIEVPRYLSEYGLDTML